MADACEHAELVQESFVVPVQSNWRVPVWLRHVLAAIEDGDRAHGFGAAIFERLELALMAGAVAGF